MGVTFNDSIDRLLLMIYTALSDPSLAKVKPGFLGSNSGRSFSKETSLTRDAADLQPLISKDPSISLDSGEQAFLPSSRSLLDRRRNSHYMLRVQLHGEGTSSGTRVEKLSRLNVCCSE